MLNSSSNWMDAAEHVLATWQFTGPDEHESMLPDVKEPYPRPAHIELGPAGEAAAAVMAAQVV